MGTDTINPVAKIRSSSLYMLALKMISYAVGFVVMVIIVRRLTIADYGIYNLLYSVLGYIGLFSSLGIPSLVQRFVPEFHRNREYSNIKRLVLGGTELRTVAVILCIILVLVFSRSISRLFKVENWINYFTIFSVAIILYHIIEIFNFTLAALFHHRSFSLSNIAYGILRALVLYVILRTNNSLRSVLTGEAMAFGFLFVILTVCILRTFRSMPTGESGVFPTRRLVRYTGTSYLNELGNTLFDPSTNLFVIAIFLDPVAIGMYAFASQILTQLSKFFPHVMLLEVIRPFFFSTFHVQTDPSSTRQAVAFLVKVIALYTIPTIVGIMVLGDKLIFYVFDPKYMRALHVLFILSVFKALLSLQFPLIVLLQSLEKIKVLMINNIFAFLSLIASLIVIRPYGIGGVALTTSLCMLLQGIFLYAASRRYIQFTLPFNALLRIGFNSALMAALLFVLRPIIRGPVILVLVVATAIALYTLGSVLFRVFDRQENVFINSLFGRKVLPA